MNLYEQVVTDSDEIYTYFEVIRQFSPARILDVGMMLKRMGAVSRQAMHCAIPQAVQLDGVDLYPQVELPIYQAIYDHIFSEMQLPDGGYDLSICLGCSSSVAAQWIISTIDLEYLFAHSSLVLFNADIKIAIEYFKTRCTCQQLKAGDRVFLLAHPNNG